jgi:hypothetical protein
MVAAVEEVVGVVEPSSTQPAVTAEEEVPAPSLPAMVLPRVRQGLLPPRSRRLGRVRVRPYRETSEAVMP